MKRHTIVFLLLLIFLLPAGVYSQQAPSSSSLRDYVGLINQSYHPGIVEYFGKVKEDLEKRKETNAAKAIDIFLRGDKGSGFIYNDPEGNLYVITNHHVITQAHTLAITFERQDGEKRKFENLRVIAADEETDLALLAFAPGDKPAAGGLNILNRQIEEGEDVYSAGFPGLGTTPLWQFGRGMVSNASARFPRSIADDTLMGPFIQHTAQIDPGNSGGPLLAAQRDAVAGYSVVGINTLSATRRQAANYAIPVNTALTFINSALNPKPETYRAALDERLAKFVEGLGVNRAVYPHIAMYLSSACIGENAEYSIVEMFEKGSPVIRRAFIDKCEDSVVGAMGYAVAWVIETSIRGQGAIKASLKDVSGAGEEYTVVFTINNEDVSSKWVREYGSWRIKSFGAEASGDKDLITQKKKVREQEKGLRTDSYFSVFAGYTYILGYGSGINASLRIYNPFTFGADFYYCFGDSGYFQIGAVLGYAYPIRLKSFALMPFGEIGFSILSSKESRDDPDPWSSSFGFGFAAGFSAKGGMMFTTAKVPGLLSRVFYQHSIPVLKDQNKAIKHHGLIGVSIGYGF